MLRRVGFPLSMDSVLLADFADIKREQRCLDLGCGAGTLMLLLKARVPDLSISGIEILPDSADAARLNLRLNDMDAEVVSGDLRDRKLPFHAGDFSFVISNPPYFHVEGRSISPDCSRAAARGELNCSLLELCVAAAYYCRNGGRFFMVYRPDRLCDVFSCLSSTGLEPKRLRLVQHDADTSPCLALIEARRGGKRSLAILPALLLHDADGNETAEFKHIYHMEV